MENGQGRSQKISLSWLLGWGIAGVAIVGAITLAFQGPTGKSLVVVAGSLAVIVVVMIAVHALHTVAQRWWRRRLGLEDDSSAQRE
jgi:hypothetical protein